MAHITLLGDSIFDNASYTKGGPAVIDCLRSALPREWSATLCAVDGATTHGVHHQLQRVPHATTHLIVSMGGNDALGFAPILQEPAESVADVLNQFADAMSEFESDYAMALQSVLDKNLATAACTFYYLNEADPHTQKLLCTALALFNDVIIRLASRAGIPLIDLRMVCNQPADYANPIEPSSQGARKIAAAILGLIADADFSRSQTQVFLR